MRKMLVAALSASMVASTLFASGGIAATTAKPIDSFRPVGSLTVPNGGIAEIIAATPDGKTLFYTNAGQGRIGTIDLTNPAKPKAIKSVEVGGEPTSVAITPDGKLALAVVITSKRAFEEPLEVKPGKLIALDTKTLEIKGELIIGNHPDSVAVTLLNGQNVAVIAIENEPLVVDDKGNRLEIEEPGHKDDISGPGYVQIVNINTQRLAQSKIKTVRFDPALLKSKGLLFPEDPQPEFVDIRKGKAAITLQENNGVAIIDLQTSKLTTVFSTGKPSKQPADLKEDGKVSFDGLYPNDVSDEPYAGSRMPDAIAWNAAGTMLYTADEGELDYTGGRGWSAWSPAGKPAWSDKGALEKQAAAAGMYKDERSEAKGIEAEGVDTAVFGKKEFAFVGSERGSFVAVYDITKAAAPKFVQLLATGPRPEGLTAIPHRGLFIASDETDGLISIYEGMSGIYKGK